MRKRRIPVIFAAFAASAALATAGIAGCGSSSTNAPIPTGGVDDGGEAGAADGGADGTAAADAPPPSGAGSGSVAGAVGGTPVGAVAGSLWVGKPDDPATTVVYVFSKPVTCEAISTVGWDTKVTDATHALEMKAFGTTAAAYSVVTTATPAPGEASVNYTLTSTSGTPNEQAAKSGTVTLTKLTAGSSAQGSFTLTFGTSAVTGTFDAVYCPGGHEP